MPRNAENQHGGDHGGYKMKCTNVETAKVIEEDVIVGLLPY